jgi:hypothetical protein
LRFHLSLTLYGCGLTSIQFIYLQQNVRFQLFPCTLKSVQIFQKNYKPRFAVKSSLNDSRTSAALYLFKPVNLALQREIEKNSTPITYTSSGIIRSSPIFKANGIKGVKHLLCSPAKSAVKKTFKLFDLQKSNFDRATLIVPDEYRWNKMLTKWKLLDISQDKNTSKEEKVLIYVWQKTKEENTIFKFYTAMKFKGKVNGSSTTLQMDSCATGTAFISKENVSLGTLQ